MELKPEVALRELLQLMANNATEEQYVTDSLVYRAQQHLQNNLGMELSQAVDPVLVRNRTLSAGQYATVAELAEQCPYEYGPAVYMARALLLRNDRLPRIYRNACENSRKRNDSDGGIANDSEEGSYKLYPNPNTGAFTVELNLQEGEVAQLLVWNVAGQQVHSQILRHGINALEMYAAKGLYLYGITVNGATRWTGKIVVTSEQ
jgi:hypothetical protein